MDIIIKKKNEEVTYTEIKRQVACKVKSFRQISTNEGYLTKQGKSMWRICEFINNTASISKNKAELRDGLERVMATYRRYPDYKYYNLRLTEKEFEIIKNFIQDFLNE